MRVKSCAAPGTTAAAIARDPAAVRSVRAELIDRRESAAQSLDFERAARVQAELEGFDWVVSEQNVTLAEAPDFGVCGWSRGVLVQFEFHAGRMCTWRIADLAARLIVPR
jgi:excinuclease ABC subunit C